MGPAAVDEDQKRSNTSFVVSKFGTALAVHLHRIVVENSGHEVVPGSKACANGPRQVNAPVEGEDSRAISPASGFTEKRAGSYQP